MNGVWAASVKMPILYHVTSTDNVDRIMVQGLVPAIGPRALELDEPEPAVFLFRTLDGVEHALMNWLGEALEDEAALALLAVELPSDARLQKGSRLPAPAPVEDGSFEVVVLDVVPPSAIRIVTMDLDEIESIQAIEDHADAPRL